MQPSRPLFIALTACLLAACSNAPEPQAQDCEDPSSTSPTGAVEVTHTYENITVLEFDASGALYVADSGTAKIHLLRPSAVENVSAGQGYNLRNVDTAIAELLGTTPGALRIRSSGRRRPGSRPPAAPPGRARGIGARGR